MKLVLLYVYCGLVSALSIWLLYKLIDQSVTLDHGSQGIDLVMKQRNLLIEIINKLHVDISEHDMRFLLRDISPDPLFDKHENEVVAAQVTFLFKNGKFLKIEFEDDTGRSK